MVDRAAVERMTQEALRFLAAAKDDTESAFTLADIIKVLQSVRLNGYRSGLMSLQRFDGTGTFWWWNTEGEMDGLPYIQENAEPRPGQVIETTSPDELALFERQVRALEDGAAALNMI